MLNAGELREMRCEMASSWNGTDGEVEEKMPIDRNQAYI